VHGADADEPHCRPGARIVAPDRDLADGAARDALAPAAGGRCVDDLGLGAEVFDPVKLVERIKRVHAAGLALAPAAMAGMHDHRPVVQPIANIPAGTSTFHGLYSLIFPRSHIAEQEARDLAFLDLLAAFG